MELNDLCQKHDLESMSVAASFFSVARHRLVWHFQRDGVVITLRSATGLVFDASPDQEQPYHNSPQTLQVLEPCFGGANVRSA